MVAAVDGSGPVEPPGGIRGAFNLVDAHGEWVWNEGVPADIPAVDGHRVVVLDPPPYNRWWSAGRAYPPMQPTMVVHPTSEDDVESWLGKVASAVRMA